MRKSKISLASCKAVSTPAEASGCKLITASPIASQPGPAHGLKSDEPQSLLESLIGLENVPNIDADLLGELYSGARHSFTAYIHGRKYSDLRLIVSGSGAMPQRAAMEVRVLNRK